MSNRVIEGLERITYNPVGEIKARLLMAHGAGAGNKHEFMEAIAVKLAESGIQVVSFNFPYMQLVYAMDKKRPPNKIDVLVDHFLQELESFDNEVTQVPLFVAGKSMGGRVASLLCTQSNLKTKIKGLIVFGYPFIPPGKPEKLAERTKHFEDIFCDSLILQGQRDTFGSTETLKSLRTYDNIQLDWIVSGDHSFKPLKSSGLTQEKNICDAIKLTKDFILEELS